MLGGCFLCSGVERPLEGITRGCFLSAARSGMKFGLSMRVIFQVGSARLIVLEDLDRCFILCGLNIGV